MEKEIQKENGMTDYQFEVFLKLIYEILDSSKNLEEAKIKIENIMNN